MMLLSVILIITSSCKKEEIDNGNTTNFSLGWNDETNISKVPTTTNFGFSSNNLPTKYDITDKFPPIGNQGSYGTCVGWATAYNLKSALSAIDLKLSNGDLQKQNNQFSPKDIFFSIPNDKKGEKCNGTQFEHALDLLQSRGVATLQTVPYENLGDCNTQPESNWTAEAGKHKIKYWRRIEATVQSIKENIANNVPVVFGARLSDNFMTWNSDAVLSSNSTYDNVGQHAGHALIISGYDNSRGAKGAFRVVNSWGENWADAGYIWVDYNFMVNEFIPDYGDGYKPLYIASNQDGENVKPDEDPHNDPVNNKGVDLAPWITEDFSTYDQTGNVTERTVEFNIYNIGNTAAKASDNWDIYYIYFNAYNANDYGIIYYDQFNTSIAANTFDCPNNNNCIFNLNIPSNNSFANVAFGSESIYRTYNMPEITGDYYLLMIADAKDVFQENNEQDNLFYTTLDPLNFTNGYALKSSTKPKFNFKNSDKFDVASEKYAHINKGNFKNAYTSEEIKMFFKNEIKSDRFLQKINASNKLNIGKNTYSKKKPGSKVIDPK